MKITKTERRVFEAYKAEFQELSMSMENNLDGVRNLMKNSAYHEAGHAVTSAFTGFSGASNFEYLTIIPADGLNGCFRQSHVIPFPVAMKRYPQERLWGRGQREIIFHLSGRVAENRINDDFTFSLDETLDELLEFSDFPNCNSLQEWCQGTDEMRALAISDAIRKRGWSAYRILLMMETWTNELMDIPIVWDVVETLADKLIAEGDLTDADEYSDLIEPIAVGFINYPTWKRRFFFARARKPG